MAETTRTERLLALILLALQKPVSEREKAHTLNLVGFSNLEIADLLETTSAVVSQHLYVARRKPRRKATRKSTK